MCLGDASPYVRIVTDNGIGVAVGITFDNGGRLEAGITTHGGYISYSCSYELKTQSRKTPSCFA